MCSVIQTVVHDTGRRNVPLQYRSLPSMSIKSSTLQLVNHLSSLSLQGISYLIEMRALDNNPAAIAAFLHSTDTLKSRKVFLYLQKRLETYSVTDIVHCVHDIVQCRQDVLSAMVHLQDYRNMFLPEALRLTGLHSSHHITSVASI